MGTGRGGSDLGGNDGVGAHGRAPLHGEHAVTATGGVEHLAGAGDLTPISLRVFRFVEADARIPFINGDQDLAGF